MAFPAGPTTGDTHTEGNVSYTFDGVKWVGVTPPAIPPTPYVLPATVYQRSGGDGLFNKIEVVPALPATPDPDTIYFVK